MISYLTYWWYRLFGTKAEPVIEETGTVIPDINIERIRYCHRAQFSTISLDLMFGNIELLIKTVRSASDELTARRHLYGVKYVAEKKAVSLGAFFTNAKGYCVNEVQTLSWLMEEVYLLLQLFDEINAQQDDSALNQHNAMVLRPLVQNLVHLSHQLHDVCEVA